MDQPSIPLPEAADIHTLSTALDGASEEQRIAWLRSLPGRQLPVLYNLAEGQTLTVEAMHRGDGEVVIHEGMNSMALFRGFQKRMVKQGEEISGYNHQTWKWLVGGGFFVVVPSPEVEGELHVDYTGLPERQHPEFPPLKSNDAGLSRFVYGGGMIDVLRRVSEHVTIGKAYLKGKERGQYFVLCRRET
jgi:hypothetical protein